MLLNNVQLDIIHSALNIVKLSSMAKGITRERIVEAALAVLDEGGIDAVTVRAVAARLDVRAPALYWHVRDKQDLLDEMGTEIQRRVQTALAAALDAALDAPHPVSQSEWLSGLAAYGRILRAEYLRHRDGARTFSGTRLTDPDVLRAQEPWLRRWTELGLSLRDAVDGAETVTAFVVGFVIEEQERAQSAVADPSRYDVETRDATLGEGAPLVASTAHMRDGDGERFERQLAAVLAGLAAIADRAE